MVLGAFLAKAQSGKVGINTETPKETLQVNGTLQVTLPEKGSANSIYENASATERKGTFTPTKMVVADANGVLGQQDIPALVNADKDKKPFYYIEFELSNVSSDYISSFDTKIPSNNYTLIVVGAELSSNETYYLMTAARDAKYFAPHNVSATKGASTWSLSADYPSASFVNSSGKAINGTWKIKCLVINNDVVNILTPVQYNLGGKETGAATSVPTGLN